jgi:hypothetical protein
MSMMDTRSQLGATDKPREAMPAPVRRAVIATVALAMLGSLYLIAVRGEALLVDLQSLARIFCF